MNFELYLSQYHTQKTVRSYRYAIEHFLFFSTTKDNSEYLDIIDYLNTYELRSPLVISALKKYFDYLIDTGKRRHHPCRSLNLKISKGSIQFQELFSPQELETLLERKERYAHLKYRNKLIISLLVYQGLTLQNIANLKVKDLNLEEGTIYLKATKTCSRRTLLLKPKQILLANTFVITEQLKEPDYLFKGKYHEAIKEDSLNRMIKTMKSKFPRRNLNAMNIRKSVIANWVNVEKLPIEKVQELSGLKWLSSVERYTKPNTENNRELINLYFPI